MNMIVRAVKVVQLFALSLTLSACVTTTTGSTGNNNFQRPSDISGTTISDTFRTISIYSGYVDVTTRVNRSTPKGNHPPGTFLQKGTYFFGHTYHDAFGDALTPFVVPSTIPNGAWQMHHAATFRFHNTKPQNATFFVGVTFSTKPGGYDTKESHWLIGEWACQPRGEVNRTLFTNDKGDWKILFKVSNMQLHTVIEDAYSRGWKLAEDGADWPGCMTSANAVFFDSSGVPQRKRAPSTRQYSH